MSVLRSIAERGYGYYLALKIGKALAAIPYYPLFIAGWVVILAAIGLVFAVKAVFWTFPLAMTELFQTYWTDTRWFSGFSRAEYRRLYTPLTANPPVRTGDNDNG